MNFKNSFSLDRRTFPDLPPGWLFCFNGIDSSRLECEGVTMFSRDEFTQNSRFAVGLSFREQWKLWRLYRALRRQMRDAARIKSRRIMRATFGS